MTTESCLMSIVLCHSESYRKNASFSKDLETLGIRGNLSADRFPVMLKT